MITLYNVCEINVYRVLFLRQLLPMAGKFVLSP